MTSTFDQTSVNVSEQWLAAWLITGVILNLIGRRLPPHGAGKYFPFGPALLPTTALAPTTRHAWSRHRSIGHRLSEWLDVNMHFIVASRDLYDLPVDLLPIASICYLVRTILPTIAITICSPYRYPSLPYSNTLALLLIDTRAWVTAINQHGSEAQIRRFRSR